jgi:antitoxin Phd
MHTWQLQEAKARLSEVIDLAEKKGPQIITRRGVETAVIVTIAEWKKVAKPMTMLELLQAGPRFEIPLPKRGRLRHRKPPVL